MKQERQNQKIHSAGESGLYLTHCTTLERPVVKHHCVKEHLHTSQCTILAMGTHIIVPQCQWHVLLWHFHMAYSSNTSYYKRQGLRCLCPKTWDSPLCYKIGNICLSSRSEQCQGQGALPSHFMLWSSVWTVVTAGKLLAGISQAETEQLTFCSEIQTSFQTPQSQDIALSVCRGENHLFTLSVKKPNKSEVQVSCWWLLAQVQPEETPPSKPRRGMGQSPWKFCSKEPLHGSVQE